MGRKEVESSWSCLFYVTNKGGNNNIFTIKIKTMVLIMMKLMMTIIIMIMMMTRMNG